MESDSFSETSSVGGIPMTNPTTGTEGVEGKTVNT